MVQTKRSIIEASNLPISIIIVGVDDANFDAMNELDSDDVRLEVDGNYAARDIVQFVPLKKSLDHNGFLITAQSSNLKHIWQKTYSQKCRLS